MSVNPATPGGYAQMQDYLDVENFADYMLLHFYGDSEDWPRHNGYAAVNAVSGDGKYRFFVWDQEIVLDYHGRAGSRIDSTGGAGSVFQKMRTSEEFRLLFADRVHKHCFNGGALSIAVSQDRYLEIAISITTSTRPLRTVPITISPAKTRGSSSGIMLSTTTSRQFTTPRTPMR